MKATKIIIMLFVALAMFGCKKKTVPDPAGTITLNMRNSDYGNTLLDLCAPNEDDKTFCHVHINNGNNFANYTGYYVYYSSEVRFAQVDANCLGDITTIPTSGWSQSVAVQPGNGYVVRVKCISEGSPYYGQTYYCRIYVTSWTKSAVNNGIIGAEIKYQYPMPVK